VGEYLGERKTLVLARGPEHDDLFATELVQDLPASATREAGYGIGADDGDELYLAVVHVGGDHPGDSVALGADREPVGGILDVAARVDIATPGQDRSTDPKVAVRSIGFERGHARSFDNI
jgi:hypothetical protein